MNVGRKAHRILGLNGLNFWGKKTRGRNGVVKKSLSKKKKKNRISLYFKVEQSISFTVYKPLLRA